MSRIWEALRQAERQRSESDGSPAGTATSVVSRNRRGGVRNSGCVPLLVYGSNTEKEPFHEETTTIDASENGCLLCLESAVSVGQRLFLTNTINQAEQECRVVRVGRGASGKIRIGVEFAHPNPAFWL